MIYSAVNYVATQLNQYLKRQHNIPKDLVIISDLGDRSTRATENQVVATLVNIVRDHFPKEPNQVLLNGNSRNAVNQGYRAVYINLYLMFVANFYAEHYSESLKFVSSIIEYFQHTMVYERKRHPDLPQGIEKLLMEMENLDLKELHNIWTLINGKYMPSVLFKVRMLPFDGSIRGQDRLVENIEQEFSIENDRHSL